MATNRRNPAYTPYREAQLAARARANAIALDQLRSIDRAMNAYAEQLSRTLALLGDSPRDAEIRAAALRAGRILSEQVLPRLERLIADGRAASFASILDIQSAASLAVAQANDIPANLLGAIRAPVVSLAGAYESLGVASATWKTILSQYAAQGAADVNAVVTAALTSGMGAEELARRLRPYVSGAESLEAAFRGAGGEITDKMLAASRYPGAARRVRSNAARIAFSETHNARAEAELQAFTADPLVRAVRWQLSPNRGKLDGPDVCDAIAQTDFYGLGPGVYPVGAVPVSPHPYDRCERVPVTRPVADAGKPKPHPAMVRPLSKFTIDDGSRISTVARSRIGEQLRNVMVATSRSGVGTSIARLAAQADAATPTPFHAGRGLT